MSAHIVAGTCKRYDSFSEIPRDELLVDGEECKAKVREEVDKNVGRCALPSTR